MSNDKPVQKELYIISDYDLAHKKVVAILRNEETNQWWVPSEGVTCILHETIFETLADAAVKAREYFGYKQAAFERTKVNLAKIEAEL